MYHRFGEDAYPSTSIRLGQFEEHIRILASDPYRVLPLADIVRALRAGDRLADRSVGITVDDAYRSTFTEAFPRLEAAGLPFTIFVNTDTVGRGAGALTWDELRTMEAAGVEIGAHSASHRAMATLDGGLVAEDLARMSAVFLAELGHIPRVFAYPYGEFGTELAAVIEDAGYDAAFGQHSGVAISGGDIFGLPRFALNERYGEPDRFATVVDALPLPVHSMLPRDMIIRTDLGAANPPSVGFSVDDSVGPLDRLACFASHDDGITLDGYGAASRFVWRGPSRPDARGSTARFRPPTDASAGSAYRFWSPREARPSLRRIDQPGAVEVHEAVLPHQHTQLGDIARLFSIAVQPVRQRHAVEGLAQGAQRGPQRAQVGIGPSAG